MILILIRVTANLARVRVFFCPSEPSRERVKVMYTRYPCFLNFPLFSYSRAHAWPDGAS